MQYLMIEPRQWVPIDKNEHHCQVNKSVMPFDFDLELPLIVTNVKIADSSLTVQDRKTVPKEHQHEMSPYVWNLH